MNKTIEKIENYKERELNKALDTLKAKYDNAKCFYNDTGYDRYFNRMSQYESEIDELEEYMNSDKPKDITTDQLKEYYKMKEHLKCLKNKMIYLTKDLNLPATADLIGITDILREY